MKWREQLRILLWKNWTLKKRSIGMTLMEIFIPLILFLIMLILRLQVPIEPKETVYHEANPLPSAGFVPILQTFCSNRSGSRSPDSFRDQSGSVVDITFSVLTTLTDWLFPRRPPGSKPGWTHNLDDLVTALHTNPWGTYKSVFTDGNVDLVSLWDEHKDAIVSMIDKAEEEAERVPFFAQHILHQVDRLSELVHKRNTENPLPYAEKKPLPEMCYQYINKTRPPSFYESPWLYDGNSTDGNSTSSNGTKNWLEELEKVWRVTEAVVCAEPSRPAPPSQQMFGDSFSGTIKDIPIADIILRTLANNPKVLYGPKDTEAERIIDTMLGTLGILDDITELANEWLRLSERIKGEFNDTKQTYADVQSNASAPSPTRGPLSTTLTSGLPTRNTPLTTTTEKTTGSSTSQATPHTDTPVTQTSEDTPHSTTTQTRPPPTKPVTQRPRPTEPRTRDIISGIIKRIVTTLDWVSCRWLYVSGEDLNIRELFMGFRTEEEIVDYFLNTAQKEGVSVLSSIYFNVNEDGTLPEHMVYKIRQNATISQSTKLVKDLLFEPGPNWKASLYYINGFVWLQDLADRAIINIYSNNTVLEPGIYVEQVPTTCYQKDEISMVLIQHMLPLVMMLSWVFPVAMLCRGIVYEKELRLKEMMKLMGLSRSVHWVGWFLVSFLQMIITMTLLTVAFVISNLMAYTNFFLLWFILLTYGLNGILFSFFVSVLFSNAKIAAACSGIFWMLTYVPYMFIAILENGGQPQNFAVKTVMSLFSTSGLGMSAKYINFFESTGVGLQFSNAKESILSEDQFSVVVGLCMSLISSATYIVLTWYIDNVMPGDYGVPAPWYFPLTRTYWRGRPNPTAPQGRAARLPAWVQDGLVKLGFFSVSTLAERMVQQMRQMQKDDSENTDRFFEEDSSNTTPSIIINRLTKIYSNGKLAVNDLSLNLHEGQILSFLGHNGAGKTTTMSILTGMIPSTSGEANIYGQDIRTEMTSIRRSLGMCPQHNVLFDSMTVEEHLKFYCLLKGTPKHSVDLEVESMLSDSGLREKRDSRVEALSGGMKRKLSIGVAFISGSRTVILDEPTAGVDPWSRREIWDLILKFKHERTIMLSTHHMDEADILGDRIAIISHGQLKSVGSSLFLKGTFGEGYHLIVAKKMQRANNQIGDAPPGMSVVEPESAAELMESSAILTRCSEVKVTRAIQMHVTSAYLRAETPRELHYILPFAEIRGGKCGPLFDYLDKAYHRLDIDSFGVSDTSLEEVFLRVTMDAKVKQGEVTLEALNDDAETGSFNREYTQFTHMDQNTGRRVSQSSIRSLPARMRRSLRGSRTKRKEAYETEEQPPSFTIETSDGRVYTPDPIRRQQAKRRSGRQRSTSTSSNPPVPSPPTAREEQAQAKGVDNRAFVRSFSEDGVTTKHHHEDGETSEEGQGQAPTNIIPPKERVNEGAGSHVLSGFHLTMYQFKTCMYKKAILTARNWKAVASQIVLPVVFVSFAMFVGMIGGPKVQDEPALDLSTAQYFNISKRLGNHYVPFGTRNPSYNWSYDAMPWDMMKTFDLKSGVGATCVLSSSDWDETNSTYDPMCDAVLQRDHAGSDTDELDDLIDHSMDFFIDPRRRYYPSCSCFLDRRGMDCESGGYVQPPGHGVVTTDIVQNITGDNMTEFLFYTSDIYRLSRYGAVVFGYDRPQVPYWLVNLPLSLEHLYVRQAAKALYDTKGWHSMPTYVNAINNAILRANLPKSRGNPAAYGISVINHPMKGTSGVNAAGSLIFGAELIIAIMVVTGFAFIPAGFVLFLVQERASKAKHLQFVSGLSPMVYWVSNILWDMLMYLLPAAFCCILFKAFGVKAFASAENYPAVVVLVLLFGWSCTPVLYPASFLFKEASAAYVFLAIFNILLGVGCLFITFLLDYFRKAELMRVSETLKSIFVIFPTFSLGRGLMDIVLTTTANDVNELIGRPERFHPFDWKVTGRNNVALIVVGILSYILTILIEYEFFVKARVVPVQSIAPVEGEEPDVAAERERLLSSSSNEDMVRLENLTKIYRRRTGLQGKHLAVHRLCLGVPKGECFGMLGVNGAGKTTTFKMLTGDHPPTGGDARIANYSILEDMNQARRHLGYCPQFDALFEELTARQHLTIYAKLRGVPEDEVPAVVEWALVKLELMSYADKPAGTYSGGNKRKLSTALALLGNPPVIFLDEPTAGMDPYAKRFLWDLILGLIEEGRCIILTSHSMEECETLCTRLAIMVAGRFRCLGSVQHLKSRYGGGYGLKLTVPGPNYDSNMRRVIQFLSVSMPLATLKERHHNMMEYEFLPSDYKLSFVFDKMRQALRTMPVVEYSISQNTLDNVFIDFVKEQTAKLAAADDDDQTVGLAEDNPLYNNLTWLNDMTPEERKLKLEDALVALTRRLQTEGSSLEDATTWNTILDILKGNDPSPSMNQETSGPSAPLAAAHQTSALTSGSGEDSTTTSSNDSDISSSRTKSPPSSGAHTASGHAPLSTSGSGTQTSGQMVSIDDTEEVDSLRLVDIGGDSPKLF